MLLTIQLLRAVLHEPSMVASISKDSIKFIRWIAFANFQIFNFLLLHNTRIQLFLKLRFVSGAEERERKEKENNRENQNNKSFN